MKVKMKEVFQGRDVQAVLLHEGLTVSILEKGEEYEVDHPLGLWLVDNGKADEIKPQEVSALEDEPQTFKKPQRLRRSK